MEPKPFSKARPILFAQVHTEVLTLTGSQFMCANTPIIFDTIPVSSKRCTRLGASTCSSEKSLPSTPLHTCTIGTLSKLGAILCVQTSFAQHLHTLHRSQQKHTRSWDRTNSSKKSFPSIPLHICTIGPLALLVAILCVQTGFAQHLHTLHTSNRRHFRICLF